MGLDHPHYRWRKIESCWPESCRSKTAVYFHGESSEPHRHPGSNSEPPFLSTALDSETRVTLGSLLRLGHVGCKACYSGSLRSNGCLGQLKKSERANERRHFSSYFPGRNA